MTEAAERILSEKSNGVGWLTFNNPERRNAMSLDMWRRACSVMDDFESDPSIRVICMRGAGGKAFVSGADISQFEQQRQTPEQVEAYARTTGEARLRIGSVSKPLIAVIQGFCVGGGVALASLADIRIATTGSIFAIPAAKLGIAYSFDSLAQLVSLVGPAFAKEMLFTGRRFSAEEALRAGLVNEVVPESELETSVFHLATNISRNAPLSLRAAKVGIDQLMLDPEKRDLALVESSAQACFDSRDYAIGRRAFMEKRVPEFTGS